VAIERAAIKIAAICGRTNSINKIEKNIAYFRLEKSIDDHKAKHTDKNEIESLPMAEDQKLSEGKRIIPSAKYCIVLLERSDVGLIELYRISIPIQPKMLNTRLQATNENPRNEEKKEVIQSMAIVPTEKSRKLFRERK
jgi:hypothetical protein